MKTQQDEAIQLLKNIVNDIDSILYEDGNIFLATKTTLESIKSEAIQQLQFLN
jgi:hypothetical protein